MSDSAASARPRQLTVAGWFVVGASVFLLLSVFDSVATLQSVDTRTQVGDALRSPTGRGLGLSVDDALAAMRAGLMVAAACAAAAAVLGYFVLQRHRGARVALTVVAVPILLTSPLTGGLVGILIAVGVATLWNGQARDWFAGRPVREARPLVVGRRSIGEGEGDRPAPRPPDPTPTHPQPDPSTEVPPADPAPPVSLSTEQSPDRPAPVQGYGAAPVHPTAAGWAPPSGPAPAGQPWGAAPAPVWGAPTRPAGVPGSVKLACILTWTFAGSMIAFSMLMALTLAVASDELVDEIVKTPTWQDSGLDRGELVPAMWVAVVMFLFWSVTAVVLAFLVWRRQDWARYVLVASAGAAFLLAVLGFPLGVLHMMAAVATVVALFTASARAWFSAPRGGPGGPPSGGGGGLPAHQGRQYPGRQYPGPQYPGPQYPGQQPPPPQQPPRPGEEAPGSGKPPVW